MVSIFKGISVDVLVEKKKEKGRGGPRTRLSCVVAAQICHLRVQLVTRNMWVGYLNDGTRH
jgi:hypothetical protein